MPRCRCTQTISEARLNNRVDLCTALSCHLAVAAGTADAMHFNAMHSFVSRRSCRPAHRHLTHDGVHSHMQTAYLHG